MPAYKCDNGKYRWGATGSCKYDSKQQAEDDNKDYYRNITIVSGSPCSGKNTYVRKNKKRGDIVWDFDKIHSALTDESTHNHIEQVRKYIFSMRDTFYNDLENEKDLRVWIINSSPIRSVRNELAKRLNANIVYLKRTKEECLKVAENERPEEWKGYIENYFERFEDIEENENINIIEVKALSDIDFTPTQGMIDEARKGLEWRKEFGRGGTEVGIRTARMIINNELTPDRVTRMFSFHSRHQVDKEAEGYNSGEKGYPSNGRIAIALWGGDAGFSWSERKREEIKEEEEKRVSAKIKTSLENKRDEHNEEIKELSLDWDASVTLPMLEKVFDRGVGAYNTNPQSVRPSVKSPEQWALARVNSFLYAMKKGKFRSGKHDTDLLPSKHPVKKEMEEKKLDMNIDCNDCLKNKRELVGTIITDGIELPLFSTKEEAEKMAEELGGSGSHPHSIDGKEYFMPFDSHEQCKMMMSKDENMEEEVVMEESYHYDKDEEEDEKKFRNNNPNVEKRTFNLESKIETREVDGKERNVVVGYGSVYNSRSENLGGFYEYISEGAFTDELINSSDVRALINHDPNLILARSKNGKGTLKLNADSKGLKYEFEMPDTSYARDLLINMKNNNLNQSSFAFTIPSGGDEWSSDEAGNNIRTINKIDRLFDISVVTYPAYSQAASDVMVAQRGLKEYKETKKLVKHSLLGLKIEINKRK